jgi:ABC-2 type transport system ATP-binding protein
MNVVDYLDYVAALDGIADNKIKSRREEMIDVCGLESVRNKDIGELSKGYRQRVGLAQAMINNPEVLILDEPTSGLDPNQIIEIRNLIKKLGKQKTVILSTHILSEVQIVCNRMIIINQGTAQVEGRVEDLLNSDSLHVKIRVANPELAISAIKESGWARELEGVSLNELEFKMPNDEIPELNKYLVERGISVQAIVPQKSLEKYFLSITSADK